MADKLADTLSEAEPVTLCDKLSDFEARTPVDVVAYSPFRGNGHILGKVEVLTMVDTLHYKPTLV